MDVVATPALVRAAGTAVAKLLGGYVPGVVREARRKRAVRRSVQDLAHRRDSPLEKHLDQLESEDVVRVVSYVGTPDFEQLAIQLTGLVLERRRPQKYLKNLRETLVRSLQLHGVSAQAEALSVLLFDELWAAIVESVGTVGGQTDRVAEIPGVAVTVSMRAAAAARNCQLLGRLRALDEFTEFASAMRSQVRKIEGRIRLPHAESGRPVPLSRLYVEPVLTRYPADPPERSIEQRCSTDVLTQYLRTVVLGDPGGGKSTLSARLACTIAGPARDGSDERVPFLVVMREYAQRFERDQMTIARYLEATVRARYQLEPPAECIDFLLLNGRAVVIMDGLDELLDTSLRRRVTDAVEAFAHAYPTTTMLVTSRRIGYDQAPLDPALFATLMLQDFDDDRVAAYTSKWFELDRSLPPAVREQLRDGFLREGSYVADLRRNPLMLSLMCVLYRGEGYIPRNRVDVYERCASLLFERWDRQRGIQVPLPFEQHVRPALWALALWMYAETGQRSAVTERELVRRVMQFLLDKRFEDPDEAEAAARAFVAYCRGRAWVLTEVGATGDGEPLFAFTHRTFLEFFAANQLVRTNPTGEKLYDRLAPHIRAQEWDVVAQLSVLLLDRNIEGGGDDFLELLVRDVVTMSTPEERVSVLTFAARLVSYFVPAPHVLRRIFDACWNMACPPDADDNIALPGTVDPRSKLSAAAWLLRAPVECRAVVGRLIQDLAASHSSSYMSSVLAVNLDQLICDTYRDDRPFVTAESRSFWLSQSVQNAVRLRPTLLKAATNVMGAAIEAVFAGDWTLSELMAQHGSMAVCEAPPIWATYRRFPLLIQEVIANCSFPWNREGHKFSAPYVWLDPRAGTFTEELARRLPDAAAPWGRLSRLMWWDVTVGEPSAAPTPRTPAFDLNVLCGCLTWEARMLSGFLPLTGEVDLPNWLRTPLHDPLTLVITSTIKGRTRGDLVEPALAALVAPAVWAVITRWAAREIDLVINDTAQML